MAKTKTNEQIFADIRERGMMTEQEMKLLLRRSNAEGKDLLDYDLVEEVGEGYGIPLTPEQGEKALLWLKRVARKRNTPMGFREIDIVTHAEPSDFTLINFYDAGGKTWSYFIPTYGVNGMKYRVQAGELVIVG